MTLLRAMDEKYSSDAAIIRAFYKTKVVKIVGPESVADLENKIAVGDAVYPAIRRTPTKSLLSRARSSTTSLPNRSALPALLASK